MKRYAIIVAGGSGKRMKSDVPKQFLELAGKPVLMRTLSAFYDFDPQMELILCLPAHEMNLWTQLCKQYDFNIVHKRVAGGDTRFQSVKNGLEAIATAESDSLVAIHDGVRPCISNKLLNACFEGASLHGNSIPSVPLKDSIRKIDSHGENVALDRSLLRAIQTPQTFSIAKIKAAFEREYQESFTDDASVLEADGHQIYLIEGEYENIKITTPEDLVLAEVFIKEKGE